MASPRPRRALLFAAALGLRPVAGGGDYRGIVEEYCNVAKDWGPLPERPVGVDKLLQVQVFIRHGARVLCSAKKCWPGDDQGEFTCSLNYLENSVDGQASRPLTPSFRVQYLDGRNSLPGNCLVGQLVSDGFEQEQRNGQRLREAYVAREGLLPGSLEGFTPERLDDLLFLRSSDVPRTKQSGMALMSGLYNQSGSGGGAPLRLHTMDLARENMLTNEKNCAAVKSTTEAFFKSYPAAAELKSMCEELGQPTDGSPSSLNACMWFLNGQIDCVMSRMCPTVPFHPRNVTIPEKFLKDDAALFLRLWKVVDEAQFAFFEALKKVGTGPFVKEVLDAAKLAAEGDERAKSFLLWSGHDTGPMEPLCAAFRLRSKAPYWPPFASMLVLELWHTATGPAVRWLSNGAAVGNGVQPFADFRLQAEALIPSEEDCRPPPHCREAGECWHPSIYAAEIPGRVGDRLDWGLAAVALGTGGATFALLGMALLARTCQRGPRLLGEGA